MLNRITKRKSESRLQRINSQQKLIRITKACYIKLYRTTNKTTKHKLLYLLDAGK
jgi:hypothetical protein